MTKDTTQLVVIEKETALKIFTSPKGLDPILKKVRTILDEFVPDIDTAKGRSEIISMAYRVAKTRTHIDAVGKEETTKQKELPKLIDAERKRARDTLETWGNEVRAPITEMEEDEDMLLDEIFSYENVETLQGWKSHMFPGYIKTLEEVSIDDVVIKRAQAVKAKESALSYLNKLYTEAVQREKLEKVQAELAAAEEAKRQAEEKLAQEKAAAEEEKRKAEEILQQQKAKAEEAKRLAEEAVARERAAAEQRHEQEIAAAQEQKRKATERAENEKQAIQDEAERKVAEAQEKSAPTPPEIAHLSQEQINQKSDQIAAAYDKHKLQKWAPEMLQFIRELVYFGGKYSHKYTYLEGTTVSLAAYALLKKIEGEKQCPKEK